MRISRFSRLLAILAPGLLLPLPGLLQAQTGAGSLVAAGDQSHMAVAPRAQAARATQSIQIDGRLDDAAWSSAPPITSFTQVDPDEGMPVSERTEVRIVYDENAIYVGAMLYDSAPVTTRLARRDASMSESDVFVVILDSYHDHQTAYRFATNPSGMKHDQLISTGRSDSSWDPVWDVATEVTPEGWSVEMRIPFSQLRFSRDEHQVWGLQLERVIHRKQEEASFAFTPKLERSGVHRFGHLEGISGIRAGQRLELLPYVTGRAEYLQTRDAVGIGFDNPFRGGRGMFGSAGLDVKYRLSSNTTVDATVNPDFGQVEVDPAVINLTAFETRFDEKRPFFIEGAEIFRFSEGGPTGSTGRGPELLYSRRVGRSPQIAVPGSAVFADAPSATTILGAAKLTGKVGDGWSIGLLEAVTGAEHARYVDRTGARNELVAEPMTNYLVARIRRDAEGGNTRMGGIFTAVNRDVSDPLVRSRLRSAAYSTGVDLNHEWGGRAWRFSSSFSPSYVLGDAAAIGRVQQASTRYFQRPDATHLSLDPEATGLAGYYAMAELNKQAGTFTGRLATAAASPGYEVNDLGFQTAADRLIFDTHFQYNQTRPGRYIRNWSTFGGPDAIWNYGGNRVMAEFNAQIRATFMNYWGASVRTAYNPETDNDRLTRGGPLARDPRGYSVNFNFNSDTRKSYTLRGNVRVAGQEGDTRSTSANLNVNYKPFENLEVRFGPELSRSHTEAQYVTTVVDPLAVHTFGHRYVFAGLDHTTFAIETRLNVTFTPALSFEMYAQPFLSNGRYGSFKELKEPRTFEFLRYGEEVGTVTRQQDGLYRVDPDGTGAATSFLVRDQDFNYRSLLGNAVLRWEWRAGSTLYLVWQQRRADTLTGMDVDPAYQRVGNFELGRDTRELFGIRPDNIFAIKMNYWLNP
jgi:hypothetical protein